MRQAPSTAPRDKSVGAALVLTFLFGPFGLLYASVAGALVLLLCGGVVAALVTILTLGLATLPIGLVVWGASMLWGGVAASRKHAAYPGVAGRLPR